MPQENPTYAIDPTAVELPTYQELKELRIWDLHYHGLDHQEEVMKYVKRMGVERVFALDINGDTPRGEMATEEEAARHRQLLKDYHDIMAGIIRIDPSRPELSVQLINEWIANGPCVGIKYAGGNIGGIEVNHPNNDPIIQRASELDAVIYIHTWMKVGGNPPYSGGDNNAGESTPMQMVELAARFPDVPMICGHSGGDWELAARAVRPYENVYFEYSGTPPWSGMVDYGVNWLGADRLVWGGHGESRSYATELSKVLDANLDFEGRKKVLGENLRRLAVPIMQRKGYDVTV